ncbi:MAG: hypothetical protein ACREB1_06760 [Sphingomicrobium sp.]
MSHQPLPDHFPADANWLAQAIDPRARLVRLVRMDETAYRTASFLDDRILGQKIDARLCGLDEAIAAARDVDRSGAHWIFHIGHVGSTLVSRLLGEIDGVLALREPRSLRDLASASEAGLTSTLSKLMSRTFRPSQRALVKATSFVSELAPLLVAADSRALFLFASPNRYIQSILAGENSLIELRELGGERTRRLSARGIELQGFEASPAHLAAAAWACEMTSLEAASDALLAESVMWADFDRMLLDMGDALKRVASHFGFAACDATLEAIAAGPLMRRYSKALEYDYSPSLRADLLEEAGRVHGADIADALAALAASGHPLIERALARSEGNN